MTFPHYIEDWLEILEGDRDPNGELSLFNTKPVVQLANYDKKFVSSVVSQIQNDTSLTSKQHALAIKIITKYQRQFRKVGLDTTQVDTHTPLRKPLREVDRTTKIVFEDGYYVIRFPYDGYLVDKIYDFSHHGAGEFAWDKENKLWRVHANEGNLGIIVDFLLDAKNKFDWQFDDITQSHLDAVADAISNRYMYLPTIDYVDNKLKLANVSPTLEQVLIDDGFKADADPLNWAFYTSKYAMEIGPNLNQYVRENFPTIAHAVLTPQHVIQKEQRAMDSQLDQDTIIDLISYIDVEGWEIIVSKGKIRQEMLKETLKSLLPEDKYNKVNLSYINESLVSTKDLSNRVVVSTVSQLIAYSTVNVKMQNECLKLLYWLWE